MTFTLINASAGSGKTHTLTHRIAAEVRAGLSPSQLIATTFTRKAAAELSDRVRRTLLEEGMLEQARGIDSALIGTVNSVFGLLLQEFALDAGISPEARVLDDASQRTAFSAAIDAKVAQIGADAQDLVARMELDGVEDPDPTRGEKGSWRISVRRLAEEARINTLGAEDLRRAADDSWREYAEAALPAAGTDLRPAWLSRLDLAIAGLRADLAASEDPDPAAGKPPIAKGSVAGVAKHVRTLEQLRRTLADADRCPWSAWVRIARVAERKAVNPEAGDYAYSKDVDLALQGLAEEVRDDLLSLPALQGDIRAMITLIMETAADSLDAYAAHKRELGLIDFIDQEVGALALIRSSERVRAVIRSRFRLLAVDEFQDTSPVQLALFLELSRLIEDKIWVGDPKQAIYGFRAADPTLMLGVIAQLEAGTSDLGTGSIENLEHSWRSQEPVLELVSSIFPRIFPDLPPERVAIGPAPEAARRRAASGRAPGRLEAWITPPRFRKNGKRWPPTAAEHTTAIADGVAALLEEPGTGPGDVAVLVRTNRTRDAVVAALAARGIPASGEGTPILATREGRILRAGLAVTLDLSDTLALTELVDLLTDHAAHGRWFAALAEAPDAPARRQVFEDWWRDPALAGLRALREDCISLTPEEMVTALVDALDLPERIRAWSDPEQRLRTLDAVRAVAHEYADRARASSAPITLTGLRAELDALDRGPDLEGIPDTVWVGTIHTAKGLEWSRVVVLLDPDPKERPQTDGVFIVPAAQLDVTAPLAGRRPRCWPSVLPGFAPLQEALAASEHARRRARGAREEAGRLQYVAFTRAQDVTILSGDGCAPLLDTLLAPAPEPREAEPVPLLRWESGGAHIHVAGGPSLPAVVRTLRIEPPEGEQYTSAATALAATDLVGLGRPAPRAGAAARFQASASVSADDLGSIGAPRRIGPALVAHGDRDWDRVGEAVHAYLALPLASLDTEQRAQAAQRLVQRWAVSRAIGPEALLRAGEAWQGFLADELPRAQLLTEQPIAWWNEDDQVMEGWIDALLRLPGGGAVLVDHKTYPGDDPVAHVREHYLGQMDTYARALRASGVEVERVLIHLPLRGEVLEVTLHRDGPADPTGPADASRRDAPSGPTAASQPTLPGLQGVLDV